MTLLTHKKISGRNKGFTLIEIMITMILVATLAAFALPRLNRLIIDQSIERATTNLRSIALSEQTLYMNTGHFWPNQNTNACSINLSAIHSTLEISFPSDGWAYVCSATPKGVAFTCYANKAYPEINLTFQIQLGSGSSKSTCISTGTGNEHHLCPKQASLVTPSCS